MKKLVLKAIMILPTVALAQNLTLICDGFKEAKYSFNSELKNEVSQNTYVFKEGKLLESTTAVASSNVIWTDTYIHIEHSSKDHLTTILIDRISGKISDNYASFNNGASIKFTGTCKPASKKF